MIMLYDLRNVDVRSFRSWNHHSFQIVVFREGFLRRASSLVSSIVKDSIYLFNKNKSARKFSKCLWVSLKLYHKTKGKEKDILKFRTWFSNVCRRVLPGVGSSSMLCAFWMTSMTSPLAFLIAFWISEYVCRSAIVSPIPIEWPVNAYTLKISLISPDPKQVEKINVHLYHTFKKQPIVDYCLNITIELTTHFMTQLQEDDM